MSSVYIENNFGHHEVAIHAISREDLIELCRVLEETQSPFLVQLRLEMESELMELRNQA